MLVDRGDELPVSALPVGRNVSFRGRPVFEKRNLSDRFHVGSRLLHPMRIVQCSSVRTASIRAKYYDKLKLACRADILHVGCRERTRLSGRHGHAGCSAMTAPAAAVCVDVCPAQNWNRQEHKAINMMPEGRSTRRTNCRVSSSFEHS